MELTWKSIYLDHKSKEEGGKNLFSYKELGWGHYLYLV